MVQISSVNIISVDKGDDSLEIEGEIIFEGDFSTPFSTTYVEEDDEFENMELEINPGRFDMELLKEMILEAVYEFEE